MKLPQVSPVSPLLQTVPSQPCLIEGLKALLLFRSPEAAHNAPGQGRLAASTVRILIGFEDPDQPLLRVSRLN
jgi:hypothetical protein